MATINWSYLWKHAQFVLQEYSEHELVHDLNRLFARKFLEGRTRDVGLKLTKLNLRFKDFDHPQYAYTINDFNSDDK